MMRALLDVNVLIALLDPLHVHHGTAQHWFACEGENGWATCPITQNGFVRIVAQPAYGGTWSVAGAVELLGEFTAHAKHEFWADSVSLTDPAVCHAHKIGGPRRVTDIYLLALARANRGVFVTLDAKVSPQAVVDGDPHLALIGAATVTAPRS